MSVTPLHLACMGGHLTVVEYLVEKGADTNARDRVSISIVILSTIIYWLILITISPIARTLLLHFIMLVRMATLTWCSILSRRGLTLLLRVV